MCTELPEIFYNKQWLVNEFKFIVRDALTGLVKCNANLALLDFGNVVVRRDHSFYNKVKILSGGASGHEPKYAGFVGEGMLTASVQGSIYTPPTPDHILRTIKELARRHEEGILVICENHISDRLAFGLAVERALNIPNLHVKFLVVTDFINVGEPKGLTGTVIVQKIAGALSEQNFFIHTIYDICKEAITSMASSLICLKKAVSPLFSVNTFLKPLKDREIEYGTGLHGQKGYLKTELLSCHDAVELLLNQITDTVKYQGAITLDPLVAVVIIINNLGHSTKIEELIFLNEVVTQLTERDIVIAKVLCSSYFTSLEMCGFSLTILKLNNKDLYQYLTAPCSAPYWKSFTDVILEPETSVTISTEFEPIELKSKGNKGGRVSSEIGRAIERAISFACGAILSCQQSLNIMDAESGDGDTGSNLFTPCKRILEFLSRNALDTVWPVVMFEKLSRIIESDCEGFLPYMYAIMFEAAARPFLPLSELDVVTRLHWVEAFKGACEAVKCYGKVEVGSNTMLDPLDAISEVFNTLHQPLDNMSRMSLLHPLDVLGYATLAAEEAVQKTKYLENKYPDPGAFAVGVCMRAIFEALKMHKEIFSYGHTSKSIKFRESF